MPIVWYASDDAERPEPVQCEEPGYPGRDEHGRVMYRNSHFMSEVDAWAHLLRSGQAGQELARLAYERAQQQLVQCTERLAREAARRSRIESAYDDRMRPETARAGSITGA
jgi:hypothetical protein